MSELKPRGHPRAAHRGRALPALRVSPAGSGNRRGSLGQALHAAAAALMEAANGDERALSVRDVTDVKEREIANRNALEDAFARPSAPAARRPTS
ncbi:MAG: hypothetical protein ACLTSX_12870 [Collinsella sp.]